ncbi:MAG: heme ABC transporter ATP-binding protein [Magnetospirillum sp.]|nr:heme ABC transporter ATP-binding protein [Magnetospirillum sp.]
MIEAKCVSLKIGAATLLDQVDTVVAPGRITAILGPNGAGKSSLLSLLAGERKPSAGQVTLEAKPLTHWRTHELARRRAVVPQSTQLAFPFTVEQVVRLGFALTQPPPQQRAAIVAQAMAAADITHLGDRPMPTLSGGERQRTHFARALAQLAANDDGHPAYLLLDEPTASLDPAHQHALLAALRSWVRSTNGGAAVVLHDLTLAARYAEDLLLLSHGKVAARGAMADLDGAVLERVYGIGFDRLTDSAGQALYVAQGL